MTTLDDLELELRKLPGVRSAGFSEREDLLYVQLHLADTVPEPTLPMQAARIAYRNSDRPVAVELVRWRNLEAPVVPVANEPVELPSEEPAPQLPSTADTEIDLREVPRETRARLLAVLTFPDTDELEVHLTHAGRRAIGRADAAAGLVAAVDATLDALSQLTDDLELDATWARALESQGSGFLVAVGLEVGDRDQHGVAAGSTPVEAAARATLHALNRTIASALDAAVAG